MLAGDGQKMGAIRPTLFIGLGGTGKEILLRLRRKFYENFGKTGLPCVAYLWIDTDNRDGDAKGVALDETYMAVRFGDAEQYALLDGSVSESMNSVFANKQNFQHIHDWLYPEVERFGAQITDGAGNVRTVGRLTFFYHYDEIDARIRTIANGTLTQNSVAQTLAVFARHRLPTPDFDRGRHVVLVFSVAGGTGGGTFLDVAFLLRKLGPMFNEITGVCLLPNVYFDSAQGEVNERSYANAYACLKELEYYTLRRLDGDAQAGDAQDGAADFHVEWQAGRSDVIPGPPFSVAYMLENRNEGGIGLNLNSRDEFFKTVAESLYMDLMPGQFSNELRSLKSNIAQLLSTPQFAVAQAGGVALPQQYARRYASFGLSKIEIPVDSLRAACVCQLEADIAGYWTRPCADPNIPGTVQGDMEQLGLTPDGFIRLFGTDWRGTLSGRISAAIGPVSGRGANCTASDVEDARAALDAMEARYLGGDGALVDAQADVLHRLNVQVSEVQAEVNKELEEWLDTCLMETGRGLKGLVADKGYLYSINQKFEQRFIPNQSECGQRAQKAEKDADLWHKKRDETLAELKTAVVDSKVRILAERQHAVTCLTERLKDAEEQYAFARVFAVLYKLCVRVASGAQDFLTAATAQMPQFLADVDGLAGPATAKRDSLLSPGGQVLFERILDPAKDLPRYYQLQGGPANGATEALLFQSRYNPATLRAVYRLWTRDQIAGLKTPLQEYCEQRFIDDFVAHPRNEDVLRHPQMIGRDKTLLAQALVRRALPWVNRRGTLGGQQLNVQRRAFIGIGDQASADAAGFAAAVIAALTAEGYLPGNISIQQTGNKSAIYLYTASSAFPLPVIDIVATTCHDAYYRLYRDLRIGKQLTNAFYKIPVHLDKRWEGKYDDLVPLGDEDAVRTKDAMEALLFGSLLKAVKREPGTSGAIEYKYNKPSLASSAPESLGNRREAINALRDGKKLCSRMRDYIASTEETLNTDELLAYCYAMTYLSKLSEFRNTSEKGMLEAKYGEVQKRLATEIEEVPTGLTEEQALDWYKQKTGSTFDWTDPEFPVLRKGKYWVCRSGNQ
ncbi:MAG: hypothetical protein NTX53_20070 [candidate division WOR-3 bacterium]|nr:hypothetical protein [candidate division WOR-3 bacterium]